MERDLKRQSLNVEPPQYSSLYGGDPEAQPALDTPPEPTTARGQLPPVVQRSFKSQFLRSAIITGLYSLFVLVNLNTIAKIIREPGICILDNKITFWCLFCNCLMIVLYIILIVFFMNEPFLVRDSDNQMYQQVKKVTTVMVQFMMVMFFPVFVLGSYLVLRVEMRVESNDKESKYYCDSKFYEYNHMLVVLFWLVFSCCLVILGVRHIKRMIQSKTPV